MCREQINKEEAIGNMMALLSLQTDTPSFEGHHWYKRNFKIMKFHLDENDVPLPLVPTPYRYSSLESTRPKLSIL